MADELTPSQFLELDKNHLKGLLLKSGGTTSHTVILARSFNIPTLVGVDIDALTPWQQQTIYIDGNAGAIVVEPGEAVARYYQQEARVQDALREQQRVWLTQQARTADGIRIEIAANIAHSVEAQAAFGNGAEGVGLFRTEMLYMDRTSAPGESELYNIFCQALESANGRSIIVRTMDIGGDKPVDYLNIPAEANPFLGYRAVRIYEEYASLFTTQLRSILRASAHGSLKIMIPMISSMEEILWVKEKLAEAKQQLRNEHIPFDEKIQLGIMLEVPSMVFMLPHLAKRVDFISVGTNDLTQYILAVDRNNTRVANIYDSLHPAMLRALAMIAREAEIHGIDLRLCGEMAGDPMCVAILIGLGYRHLSMNGRSVARAKYLLRRIDYAEAENLAQRSLEAQLATEVRHQVAAFMERRGMGGLIRGGL